MSVPNEAGKNRLTEASGIYFSRYYKVTDDVVSRKCGTHGIEEKCVYDFGGKA